LRRSVGVVVVLALLALLVVPTPSAAQGPTSPPGAPTGVTASPGTLSATVQWTPSGPPADSQTVTSNPGGVTATVDGTATQATVTGLGYLMSYTFTVTSTNSLGTSPSSAASNTVTPGPPGGIYHLGFAVVLLNKNVSAGNPVATNFGDDPVHLPGVTAVVINLTASQATVSTAVQAVVDQAVVASVSVAPGQVQSSLEVFAVPTQLTQAALQVTAGTAHVELDFVGYFTGPNTVRDHSGQLTMIAPATLADASVAVGSVTNVAVLGHGGIPAAHVAAALLNVTATNAVGGGAITLIPTGGYASGITTLGFATGQTAANRAIVAVPSNGTISIIDRGAAVSVHIDVLGWFTDGTDPAAVGAFYNPLIPTRLVDTAANGGPLAAGAIDTFPVYGEGGAPPVTATAPPTSAMVRISAVNPSGAGSIAVAGTTVLDFVTGQTASRSAIVHLANDGSGTLGVAGSATNVTVDLIAYFAGDLIVPGSTKVLTSALLAGITKLGDDDSVTFAPGTQLSPLIRLNDVIVAGISPTTPQGFLLRVQSITPQSDGSILVGARRALLPEALTAFTIDWVYAPNGTRFGAWESSPTSMIVPSATVASGNPFPPPPNSSINDQLPHLTLSDIIALANLVTGGGLTLGSDGSLHLFPAPWADLALTDLELQVLPHFHIEYNFFNNTAKAAFAWSAGVKLAFELSVTKDLLDINHKLFQWTLPLGPAFDIQIGPVPVIVTPTITLALTFDASISVGLRFAYHLDKFMQITESYDGSQFSTSYSEKVYVNGFDPPAFFANAAAKVAIHAGPGLTFYRFCLQFAFLRKCVNPFTVGVDANRFWQASATVTCTPQPSCFPNPWWTLSMGDCVGVFMALDLFLIRQYFQRDLACTELVLLQSPGPHLNVTITPATATVPRFHIQHFHATVSNSPDGVSFSVDGGNANGTLSNQLLTTDVDYTAPGTPGDYRLIAAAIDDSSSVAYAQIHVPADPPSSPTNVVAALSGTTSVTVTWGAPADTGGVPITDYKVVSSDGTTVDAGSSTSATFTGLTPNMTYTFTVTATNQANLTSVPSIESAPITTPPGGPMSVIPTSIDFGSVAVGQSSAPQTVTVTAGGAALVIASVALGGANPGEFAIQSDQCSTKTIPSGGSCTFAVVFKPTSQGTTSSAVVIVTDSDASSPQLVAITAKAAAPFQVIIYSIQGHVPQHLVAGANALWFIEEASGQYGLVRRFDRQTQAITTAWTPPAFNRITQLGSACLEALAIAPDQAVWVADQCDNLLARIDAGTGSVTTFSVSLTRRPTAMTWGPNSHLWLLQEYAGITEFDPTSGLTTFHSLCPTLCGTSPIFGEPRDSIITGPDGNLWFSDGRFQDVGSMTPAGVVTAYALPSGHLAEQLTVGPDNAVWFTEPGLSSLGRVSPSGSVSEFALPPSQSAYGIATAADGHLWYVGGTNVGRLDPATGTVDDFSPLGTFAYSPITVASDGTIWLAPSSNGTTPNQLANLVPASTS
jgi:streptogramin lyase